MAYNNSKVLYTKSLPWLREHGEVLSVVEFLILDGFIEVFFGLVIEGDYVAHPWDCQGLLNRQGNAREEEDSSEDPLRPTGDAAG